MFRFVLACMVIVALSIFATSAQFMVSGIEGKRQEIALRNVIQAEQQQTAATVPLTEQQTEETLASEQTMSPESLNAINSAAGGEEDAGFPRSGFTNEAPAALQDDAPAGTITSPQSADAFSN